ncbi:MAG: hypothetical protein JRG96_13290 [Deltaproteobacteria bacterium]|nr:hypothetical protein [Deltaproteobacteria bacterium]
MRLMLAHATLLTTLLFPGPASAELPAADVSEDYLLHCSACHGLDGAGVPGVVPTLHGVAGLLDSPGGREYLASVPGVAQAPLSDARLARLLDWVLLTFSGRAPEPGYAPDEVGALRALPLRDPGSAREALLAPAPRPHAETSPKSQ